MITETWKRIPGFPAYLVSDLGNFRRTERHGNHLPGEVRKTPDSDGYSIVSLWDGERQRMRRAALLVLLVFCPEPRNGRTANHKNGVHDDDRYENLEYATFKEQVAHAQKELGRDYRGSRNPDARLTEKQVLQIRKRAAKGEAYLALAEAFGVSGPAIGGICCGATWKHVGGPLQEKRAPGRR